ncbi:MAG TPA: hypothetical protein VKS43_16290 [Burkholderiales bacterium]|nr:hypothetical protein [Burkholderiales bacterium]
MAILSTHILSKAQLAAIGALAAEWSYVELALETLIWEIIQVPSERGYAITTHIGSETRLHILLALLDRSVVDAAHRKEIGSIAAEFRRLRTERNNIVHAVWVTKLNKPFLLRGLLKIRGRKPAAKLVKVTAKGSVKITNLSHSTKSISALASEVNSLLSRIYAIIDARSAQRKRVQALAAALRGHPRTVLDPDPTTKE